MNSSSRLARLEQAFWKQERGEYQRWTEEAPLEEKQALLLKAFQTMIERGQAPALPAGLFDTDESLQDYWNRLDEQLLQATFAESWLETKVGQK